MASKYPNVVVVTDDETICFDEFKVNTVLAVCGDIVKFPDDNVKLAEQVNRPDMLVAFNAVVPDDTVKPFEQVNNADIPVAPVNVFVDDPV